MSHIFQPPFDCVPAIGRRRFLLSASALAAATLLGPFARFAPAAVSPLKTVTRAGYALGTQVRITILHSDTAVADRAAVAALDELQQIDRLMSIYRPDSQVSILNRTGQLSAPDPRLLQVLREAQAMSDRTSGAFDITVQPLWEVFAAAQRAGRLPTAAEIAAARPSVNWQKIDIHGNQVSLAPGMAITLNGIAQGYAADRALLVLREHGVEHALIDTGEMASLGRNGDDDPWKIGIQHPRHENAYVAMTRLDGRCLATSGDYATTFTPDHKHHHIFDPATGQSPRALASVSVLAPSACLADALSTAIFVMGPERGLALLAQMPNTDALLIRSDMTQVTTKGFPLAS